jgi:hypothetical protein
VGKGGCITVGGSTQSRSPVGTAPTSPAWSPSRTVSARPAPRPRRGIPRARFGKRRYPKYLVSRSWALFGSRQTLREFEAAMQIRVGGSVVHERESTEQPQRRRRQADNVACE